MAFVFLIWLIDANNYGKKWFVGFCASLEN